MKWVTEDAVHVVCVRNNLDKSPEAWCLAHTKDSVKEAIITAAAVVVVPLSEKLRPKSLSRGTPAP